MPNYLVKLFEEILKLSHFCSVIPPSWPLVALCDPDWNRVVLYERNLILCFEAALAPKCSLC